MSRPVTPGRVITVLAALLAVFSCAACGASAAGEQVLAHAPGPAVPGQPPGTVSLSAGRDFAAAVKAVQDAITARGGTVEATVDLAAQAKVPATVVVGGPPASRLPLLRASQTAGVNLPERYLLTQDPSGAVNLTYDGAGYVAVVAGDTDPAAGSVLADTVRAVAAQATGTSTPPVPSPLLGVTPTGYLTVTPGAAPVAATVTRLRTAVLASTNDELVGVLDLAAGSTPPLRPTTEVLVRNPPLEAPLLAAHPGFGLELPLRFLVWQDAQNTTQVGYPDVAKVAARHGIAANDPAVTALAAEMARLAKLAAG